MSYRTNAAMSGEPEPREPTNYECDCVIAECEAITKTFSQLLAVISENHGEDWTTQQVRSLMLQVSRRWTHWGKRRVVREAFRHARGIRR